MKTKKVNANVILGHSMYYFNAFNEILHCDTILSHLKCYIVTIIISVF